ncbi:MAG: hypothetical protein Mars2KO_03290 [Maribacter sp.]
MAELILTMSSGAEVAKETTVMPITILGIFNFNDKATADFNNQFPPAIRSTSPEIIKRRFCIPRILTNIAEDFEINKVDQMNKKLSFTKHIVK